MQCYFSGGQIPGKERLNKGFVSFLIPDLDIQFKAAYKGTKQECEYAGLLALLEFIELNPQLFEKRSIEILSDSVNVISQVNLKMGCDQNLESFRNLALVYRKKISFTLNWVPNEENPAQHQFV